MTESKLPILQVVLMRLAQLRRESVDVLQLQASLRQLGNEHNDTVELIKALAGHMTWPTPRITDQPDAGRLPCLLISPDRGLGIITARNPAGQWVVSWWVTESRTFEESATSHLREGECCVRMRLTVPYAVSASPSFQLIWVEIWSHTRKLIDICAGTIAISLLALATSFYSMQVYDRVVPTQASGTLWVLSLGVMAAVLFEMLGKWIRSHQIHELTDAVDQNLARNVYTRFLSVRLDQLPASVGSTASRLRGYESARGFIVSLTTQAMVDIPLALLTLFVLIAIGGFLALVPAVFMLTGLALSLYFHVQLEQLAKLSTPAQHLKSGLLVESIEGAETIKSGQGGWRMLSRWLDITDEARQYEQRMRQITEHSQYILAMFQQAAYVGLIATGALMVGHGDFTMGGLIACSILSGRILGPVGMVPQLVMQWAHTKIALQDLDRLWKLASDHPEGVEPLVVEPLRGQFELTDVEMQYAGTMALKIPQLRIQAGERVALLGPIGSGKTSFLRVLSGMYKPQAGRVLLDGIELELISKHTLADYTGYVGQDGRLFAGTLRDNLVLGLADPGDEALLQAARRTGLLEAVITVHPKGLAREIFEGGQGLSGGQRQLVHITRALLRAPRIWLLDEPTASMDNQIEQRVLNTLAEELQARPGSTLVLVTHKPQLLSLVNRIIIIANQQIIMDGPRDAVLQKLQEQQQAQTQAATVVANGTTPHSSSP
jgi:ATP-binding cassette, subfamily C, bacterial LapB